jgi:hypothetical protein
MSVTPYPTAPNWPADANREHYLASARKSCPAAAEDKIEQLARLSASQDANTPLSRWNKGLVTAQAATFDGEVVNDTEAQKLRALQPKLGCRFDRKAA